MIAFRPNHVYDHPPSTNETEVKFQKKMENLKELVKRDTTTPIEQLYDRATQELVRDAAIESGIQNPDKDDIAAMQQVIVDNFPSYKSTKTSSFKF